jgi:hydrogenase nickel incorporation protein HypA/HybF
MHEVGLMQQTLELALEAAKLQRASRVHRLTMRIGPLAGVVPDALRFAFEVVTHGTQAEGAALDVQVVAVVCWCSGCAMEFRPADLIFACPNCGHLSSEVRHGAELDLVSVEVS